MRFHQSSRLPRSLRRLVPLCLLLGLLAEASSAQESEPPGSSGTEAPAEAAAAEPSIAGDTAPPSGVEVMRVRGRGISSIQTEVPASVTQFDAATIEALGAQDVSDLARVTPNVSIVQPGATQATFFIRGVGLSDFSSNAAGAVTVFQDDVALNAPAIQTGQLFDIEGVELVRGPQGTGHFRNASAGAIRVRSRRPTGNYSAQLRSTLSRYDADPGKGAHDASIQEYEGYLETPIVDDLVSTRFAFRFRDADPFKSNGCGDAPPLVADPTGRNGRIPRLRAPDARRMGLSREEELARASVCGERGTGNLPPPPTLAEQRAGIEKFSLISPNLPSRVGDQHNWAARGTLRLNPRDSEWDLLFNAHGSRLDQQTTLGQAIGIGFKQNLQVDTYGGATSVLAGGYQDPDLAEEFAGLLQAATIACGGNGVCASETASSQFENNLLDRPLDLRPFRGDYDEVGKEARDTVGAFVSAEGKLGDLSLYALASYDQYERTTVGDVDFTPDPLVFSMSRDEAWQTYEELRLSGELRATPFSWEVGSYYLYEDLQFESDININNGTIFDRVYTQNIHSFGLWGEFFWDFTESLTLEGGVRWNLERKDFEYSRTNNIDTRSTQQATVWSEPTGQLVLRYLFNDRSQMYARYTRGFKAGHYNAQAAANLSDLLAEPETNDAWELGLQGGWWDGRIRGNTSFFFYRYQNYQVFLFSDLPSQPPTLEIVNAAEAELYGLEIEGQFKPLDGFVPRAIEGLTLTANFSWLQGQYIDFQQRLQFISGGKFTTETVDYSGNQLANAPRYSASGSAEWNFGLGRYGYLIPRYDLIWTDEQFFDPTEGSGSIDIQGNGRLPDGAIGQKAFMLHNLRLAYRTPTGNVEVSAWVRNLTDEVYKTFAFDSSRFNELAINFVGDPRTIGVDLTVTF